MTNSFVSLLELDSEDNTCNFRDYCQMADLHGLREAIANHIKDSYNSSVQTYMEEHNVASLVGLIVHKLAKAQPGDPLGYIVDYCVKEQNNRASMGLSENELVLLLGRGELDQAKTAIREETCRLTGVDEYNRNPLHLAVFNCETDEGLEVLTMLLAKGCPGLNGKDNEAWTPLHWASFVGNEEAAQLLVDYKADLSVENSLGRTPYLVAADWGNDAITELLDEAERRNADQAKEMLKSSRPGSNELGKFEAVVNVKSASSETACKRRSDAVFEEVHIRLGRVYRVGDLTEQEKAVLASNAPHHIPIRVVEQARFLSNNVKDSHAVVTQSWMAESGTSQPPFVAPMGQNVMAPIPTLNWLWIGNRRDASDKGRLVAAGIKYVVNCTVEYLEGGVRNYHEVDPDFRYCRIPLRDNEQQILGIPYLKKAWDFIDDAHKHADGNILIHCIMGQSRSVIVLVSYLMRHLDIDYESALKMVVAVRPMAEPNSAFEKQLLEHDANGAIRGGKQRA
ncbi:dual specificity protein phosphatase, putative [Perkinsus marinus ATCC 50983]|uniref:protein-tyrosine-phosphatase n=1 Tax=Perkinsus marinus (strain ATCC 50983 / TXsc) TaxID=423536 RepID=C5LDN6_PERM5|nr:dual specificity protein phosphatase, putative [Perkinsus marinus ATCC 50983]EER05050.1 dual specificity protein phosphatase, putative [Perkinsus marinus ATCC 50983]|eukprot:XP_002773234.1 dual specificity protein phosphatase, putative [Perkinsus marinus ATCC 50983]